MSVDPRWRENQEVHRAASGSANELVPALARIIETGHWAEFTHPMRGVLRFGSFAAYCDEFLGLSAPAVEALLERTNAKAAAGQVRRLLREAVAPAAGAGESGVSVTNPQDRQDAGAVLARLKRDDPDLAQQVIDGDLTANAAAVAAGIRHRYARVRTDDPARAVAVLLRHYTAEQLLDALERS